MNLGIARRFTTAGVLAAAAGSLAVATVTGAAGASQLPRAANQPAHSASQPAHSASQPAHSASQPAHSASQPAHSASAPHRQIGTAELTYFKVVLTATRTAGQPPTATVTVAGYERSGAGWRLLAVKRLGKPGQWFWHTVQTCSLEITETKGISPVQVFDSAKISLLATPALGCIQSFSERWKP
jgi:hypothetical protein